MTSQHDRDFDHEELKSKTLWRIIIAVCVVIALLWVATHK